MNKQNIWLIALSMLFTIQYNNARAQGNYVYQREYLYSPFNSYSECLTTVSGCATWLTHNNCFEGWGRAMGSPSPFTLPTPEYVFMWYHSSQSKSSYQDEGEGIFHEFKFQQNCQYNIKVGIKSLNSQDPNLRGKTIIIEIWAINNIKLYHQLNMSGDPLDCSHTALPYLSNYTNPTAPFVQPQLLGRYTVNQSLAPSNNTVVTGNNTTGGPVLNSQWEFTTPLITTSANDEILIMAYNTLDTTIHQTELELDYVEVCRACSPGYNGTTTYTTNPIPDGHTIRDNIIAGNPTITPLGTQTQQNKVTEFYGNAIELIPNFFASPNAENYFLACAPIYQCSSSGYPGPSGLNKPGKNENYNNNVANPDERIRNLTEQEHSDPNKLTKQDIYIYPNPNPGTFKIQFAEIGTYDINVVNVVGSTVYSEKVEGQQTDIQLDNKLPSGTYTVQINGEGVRHVERITVTR